MTLYRLSKARDFRLGKPVQNRYGYDSGLKYRNYSVNSRTNDFCSNFKKSSCPQVHFLPGVYPPVNKGKPTPPTPTFLPSPFSFRCPFLPLSIMGELPPSFVVHGRRPYGVDGPASYDRTLDDKFRDCRGCW
jgi:hypothetical protein